MKSLVSFLFAFLLFFSSSCAVKKSVLRVLGISDNIPTKVSPFSENKTLSVSSELFSSCSIFKQDFLIVSTNTPQKELCGGNPVAKNSTQNTTFIIPECFLGLKCINDYTVNSSTLPLYLKLGRIIYYA